MSDRVVADRYAQALVGMISDLKELDRIDSEVQLISTLIETDDTFRRFFMSPRILPNIKKDLVKKVFKGRISTNTLNMVLLIIDKHRENTVREIARRFSELADELRGVETGQVITAVPMHPEEFALLEERVQKFSGRKITLNQEVDPAIIGGVILSLGNHVIDGSIRFRLDKIRRDLMELKTVLPH